MRKFSLVILASVLLNALSFAQDNTTFGSGIAQMSTWDSPFLADMHSSAMRLEIAMTTNHPEYDLGGSGTSFRPFMFTNMGADIPFWAGNWDRNRWGLSVTVPFIIDVWTDLFEPTTADVINTSYRFGGPEVSVIYRFLENRRFHNCVVKMSAIKHESTHLGDELTIYRMSEGIPISRINVAYMYSELVVTLNHPEETRQRNHGWRAGLMLAGVYRNGWYNMRDVEGDATLVHPSRSRYEYYIQYQYQSAVNHRNIQRVFSTEVRNRVKYNFPTFNRDETGQWIGNDAYERRMFSLNAYAGIRYCCSRGGYMSKVGLGIRAYHGINPYGQFRAFDNFNQIGIALTFE